MHQEVVAQTPEGKLCAWIEEHYTHVPLREKDTGTKLEALYTAYASSAPRCMRRCSERSCSQSHSTPFSRTSARTRTQLAPASRTCYADEATEKKEAEIVEMVSSTGELSKKLAGPARRTRNGLKTKA
jgi:hypothetical protein